MAETRTITLDELRANKTKDSLYLLVSGKGAFRSQPHELHLPHMTHSTDYAFHSLRCDKVRRRGKETQIHSPKCVT